MGVKNRKKLADLESFLRENFKTPYPVEVQYRRLEGRGVQRVYGETYRRGRQLIITLDPRMILSDSIGIMIHEWAHAHVWRHETMEKGRVHHDAEWGLAYAKIYSAWHDRED